MVVESVSVNTCSETSSYNTSEIKKKKRKKKSKKQKLPNEETCDILNETNVTKRNKINVHLQPVITKDSRCIICPCGNTIAVFRRKTGLLENVFSEHKYDVSNIYINHQDPTQVISCSSREFLVWDYEDVSLAKKHNVSFQAVSWYVSPKRHEDIYFTRSVKKDGANKRSKKGKVGESDKLELVKWNLNDANKQVVLGSVSRCSKCVVISRNGEYVVYTYKNKLSIYKNSHNTDNASNSFTFDDTQITCVALHPTELVVASGDKRGKIVLWYNLFGNEKQICTKLHWHNLSVADILFTNDGNYLMSGGKEGVLVTWQLETQEKSFLPRLGGAIHHLVQSSDDQYVTITLDNNMLKILSTVTSQVTKTIKYLAPANELAAGLSYHSPTDCLVLNGKPEGVLQFYHPADDVLKLSIDIIGENRVSDAEGRYVYPTKVKLVAFSQDGIWMATVDVREDRILPTERKLKFWKYSEENKNYSLNTLVDPPHKDTINSLSFCPLVDSADYEEMVVTTSNDGDIKTWVLEKGTDENGAVAESWQIHCVGSYGTNKCKHASFSQDGTILAVLFSAVTLWNPENLSFKRCLPYNAKSDEIKHMAFGFKESSHYLIGYAANYLIVWDVADLIKSSILWMLEAKVCFLTCDPFSKYCAVFIKPEGNPADLYLFDPVSPPPVTSYQNVTQGYGSVSSAMFTKKAYMSSDGKSVWDQTGQLYILTSNSEILAVSGKEENKENERKKNVTEDVDDKSGYENLFGNIIEDDELSSDEENGVNTNSEQHIPSGNHTAAFIRKLMSTPTQALPSADIMCMAYMKTLLTHKAGHSDKPNAMEIEDAEESDEVNEPVDLQEERPIEDNSSGSVSKDNKYTPSHNLTEHLKTLDFSFVADAFK